MARNLSCRASEERHQVVEQLSDNTDISKSDVLREAIDVVDAVGLDPSDIDPDLERKLRQKNKHLTEQLREKDACIESLERQLDKMHDQLRSERNKTEELTNWMATVEETVGDVGSSVDTHQDAVQNLMSEVGRLRDDIQTHRKQMRQQEHKVDDATRVLEKSTKVMESAGEDRTSTIDSIDEASKFIYTRGDDIDWLIRYHRLSRWEKFKRWLKHSLPWNQ